MPGTSTVLVGLQYGDEGKGRILDKLLKSNPDDKVVARFNGGPNAGHTVKEGESELKLHQIPSGVLDQNAILYIATGCVINPEKLVAEIGDIERIGKQFNRDLSLNGRLFISSKVTLIQPHQQLLDGINGMTLGTTGNGIGYAYAGKALRKERDFLRSLRLGDYLADSSNCQKSSELNLLEVLNEHPILNRRTALESLDQFNGAIGKLQSYVSFDPLFLEKKVRAGLDVFFEGAQAFMLDVDHGTYPFVTSSNTVAGAAYVGGDLSPKYHHKTIGVAKAIMSRVGNGPFVSEFGGEKSEIYCMEDGGKAHTKPQESAAYNPQELLNSKDQFELGIALRMLGNEYGATTGRPRRLGMLDLVQLKQACALNGVDELYINKFDQLALFRETVPPGVPVVTGYVLGGKEIDYVPASSEAYRRVDPIITYLPHLPEISHLRQYNGLPQQVKTLISFIEDFVEVKIHGIGVGPERDEFVDTSPEERMR
ncbi:adenylosuccinate synthetase [Candidatus Woesearchaeota archaeon]|nr:adenylosuccinate synthetase [Candidatus Woesearchaeota archaeon]